MGLNEFLESRKHIYPFHMPGHKRNSRLIDFDFWDSDITEVHGADNLHQAEGLIKELQEKIARLYGSDESFVLVNGSSCGIEAAVMAAGKKIILGRNSHRSAYSGLILSGAEPSYILPGISPEGITMAVTLETLESAIQKNPDADAVFLTSPTFEGYVADIEKIALYLHKRGKILIVDEAHGAHFGLHGDFPKSAVSYGADIVIQSLHKTLPAPTQCAVLHVTGDRVDRSILRKSLNILQTSSPSYFFMAAVEKCIELIINRGDALFADYSKNLMGFREQMSRSKNIRLLDGEEGFFDRGKLLFYLDCDLSGIEFMDSLRERYGVELEMCGLRHAVAMTGIADTKDGFDKLLNGVLELDANSEKYQGEWEKPEKLDIYPDIERIISPREAFFTKRISVLLRESAGCIAADFIIPYPPGIPLVVPGELITERLIQTVESLRGKSMNVIGVGNTIDVVSDKAVGKN